MKQISLFDFLEEDYKKQKRKLFSLDDQKIYYIIQQNEMDIIWLKDENGVSDLCHKKYINLNYKKLWDKKNENSN